MQEINDLGLSFSAPADAEFSSYDLILKLCHRYHIIARQLRARHSIRPTLEIEDKYDVQDLFHALNFT
ncbi:hypothetical protein [Paenibacillus sp. FSL E2-0178]|uniref:PD-(D/E)XK nuclease domain-containing protein n=1 Tax=Paenibacillus sp. FSL E2-0178 TaxID=2921361 RepID=UPI003159027F